jgi:hypothetical protein
MEQWSVGGLGSALIVSPRSGRFEVFGGFIACMDEPR